MFGKVYIERIDTGVRFAETENGRLIRYLFISDDDPTGSIYRGKVERVTGAGSFVNIGRNNHAFLSQKKCPGDYVTVMVARPENGEKGCLVTEKISLSGKYVVAVNDEKIGFSRKSTLTIEDKKTLSEKFSKGIVVRTSFCLEKWNEGIAEAEDLSASLEKIKKQGENMYEVACLYKPDPLVVAENMSSKERGDFAEIREEVESVFARKVVCNGVELVFDNTEAMTVVDVNSHLNTTKYHDSDSYAYATNLIAVEEVCRQIRLRNIGGIIAVDLVSMKDIEKIEKIKKHLDCYLKCDDVMAKAEFCEKLCIALISRTKRF